jgi:hypothetical protein
MDLRCRHGLKQIGGAEGIRTPDPLDANEVRYRTALQPLIRKSAREYARGPTIRLSGRQLARRWAVAAGAASSSS